MEQSSNFLIDHDGNVVFSVNGAIISMQPHLIERMRANPGDYMMADYSVIWVKHGMMLFPDGTVIRIEEILASL